MEPLIIYKVYSLIKGYWALWLRDFVRSLGFLLELRFSSTLNLEILNLATPVRNVTIPKP